MRFYIVSALVARQTSAEVEIGGYKLPKINICNFYYFKCNFTCNSILCLKKMKFTHSHHTIKHNQDVINLSQFMIIEQMIYIITYLLQMNTGNQVRNKLNIPTSFLNFFYNNKLLYWMSLP